MLKTKNKNGIKPKVSIVITTYNRAHMLCEAIESAIEQTYSNKEIIVVDDGSTDSTKSILKKYMQEILYIRQENNGRASAKNTGIRASTGRYISFLDSDDIWFPNKLERQISLLHNTPEIGLVYGYVKVIDKNGKEISQKTKELCKLFKKQSVIGETYERFALQCRFFTSTITVRKTIIKEIGLYDENIPTNEDLDLYLRLVLKVKYKLLEGQPVAKYRIYEGNVDEKSHCKGIIKVCKKHLKLLNSKEHNFPSRVNRRKAMGNFYLRLADCYYILSQFKKFRQYLFKSLLLDFTIMFKPKLILHLISSILPKNILVLFRRYKNGKYP